MSGVTRKPDDDELQDAAEALEQQHLALVAGVGRKASQARLQLDDRLKARIEAHREAGRLNEDDTGVHRFELDAERRAFARRLSARPSAPPGEDGPTTLRPGDLVGRLVGGRDEHVVVLDRDPAVVAAVRSALEQEGYKVRSAENGIDGLARLLRSVDRPDVLFIDMQLAELNGQGVLAALNETALADLPYVMLVDGEDCGAREDVDHVHREHLDPEAVVRAARVKVGERRAVRG